MNNKIKIKKRNLRVKIVGISVIDFLKWEKIVISGDFSTLNVWCATLVSE